MLGTDGIVPQKKSTVPTAITAELEEFDRHMVDARGLAASTRAAHIRRLQDFLVDRFGARSVAVSTLTPTDVAGFMARYTAGFTPGSIKAAGASLRSYFVFKSIWGERIKSAGTLHFCAKGKRIDILSLPDATGAAIVDYLRNGRPRTTRRELFVRHRPPNNAPVNN
jgi:hypothetical protein